MQTKDKPPSAGQTAAVRHVSMLSVAVASVVIYMGKASTKGKEMFTIEKAGTAPPPPVRCQNHQDWPFCKMEVGDMVKIEADKPTRVKAQRYCHVFGVQKGWSYATKTIDGILHIWRIA